MEFLFAILICISPILTLKIYYKIVRWKLRRTIKKLRKINEELDKLPLKHGENNVHD